MAKPASGWGRFPTCPVVTDRLENLSYIMAKPASGWGRFPTCPVVTDRLENLSYIMAKPADEKEEKRLSNADSLMENDF
jgi:hypothetical protein